MRPTMWIDIRQRARSSRTAASTSAHGARQRAVGQDGVPVLREIALDHLALVLQLRRRDARIDEAARRDAGLAGGAGRSSSRLQMSCARSSSFSQKSLLGVRPEDLVELAHLAGLGVFLEELVTEERLELGRVEISVDGVFSTLKMRALSWTRMPPCSSAALQNAAIS